MISGSEKIKLATIQSDGRLLRKRRDMRCSSFLTAFLLTHLSFGQVFWTFFDTTNTPLDINTVNFLVFDKAGSLWTATETSGDMGHGIWRYDGLSWVRFDTLDHPALSNGVRCAAVDTTGNMWFGVYNSGLLKFDGTTWTLYSTSGLLGNGVGTIAISDDNVVWMASGMGGLSRFDGTSWTTWTYAASVPLLCITSIEFYDDLVWVGSDCNGGLANYDPATNIWSTVTGLPYGYVSALKNDGQGNLWVGYSAGGNMLTQFDGNIWTDHYPFPTPLHSTAYNSFALDLTGKLWCSAVGLWSFDDPLWSLYGSPLPSGGGGCPNQNIAISPSGSIYWAVWNGIWVGQPSIATGFGESTRSGLCFAPNPGTDQVQVRLPSSVGSGILRLYDLRGMLVQEQRIELALDFIQLAGLTSGSYTAVLSADDGERVVGRLILL